MKWNEESCRSDLRSNFTDFLITCWPSALLSVPPEGEARVPGRTRDYRCSPGAALAA
jgi:hypothetical protein